MGLTVCLKQHACSRHRHHTTSQVPEAVHWAAYKASHFKGLVPYKSLPHSTAQTSLIRALLDNDDGAAKAALGLTDQDYGTQPQPCTSNPLEQLRVTSDPAKRAALLQQLDSAWSDWEAVYRPSMVELCFMSELGISQQAAMMAAMQAPGLAHANPEEAVKPSIAALLAAGVDKQAAFFLLSRPSTLHLLALPPGALQRWMDFLLGYGLSPRDLSNFLSRAPAHMLRHTTLYEAGRVAQWLRASAGLSPDYLASRVFAVYPQVLGRSVESELAPITAWLMGLGLEPGQVSAVVRAWPEVLMRDMATQLQPFKHYLMHTVGAKVEQVAAMVQVAPHLLALSPEALFGQRLQALQDLGISRDDIQSMLAQGGPALLTAPGGVTAQLQWLQGHGFSTEQLRQLAISRPQVLSEKPHELERKWAFIRTCLVASPPQQAAARAQDLANVLPRMPMQTQQQDSQGGNQAAALPLYTLRNSSSPSRSESSSGQQANDASADSSLGLSPNRGTEVAAATPSSCCGEALGQSEAGPDCSTLTDERTDHAPSGSTPPDLADLRQAASADSSASGDDDSAAVSHLEAATCRLVLSAPALLSEPLSLVVGPRVTYVQARPAVAARFSVDGALDYSLLLALPEEDWVSAAGISANEYKGHRVMWEERYDAQLQRESAEEFQDELRRIGIYEGA